MISQRNSNKKTNYMVNNPHKVFKPRMPLWPSKRALTVPISWVENCHQFCLELFYAFFLFVKIKTLWLKNNLFIFAISWDPVKSKEIWDPAKSCKLWISPHICLFKWHFAEKNQATSQKSLGFSVEWLCLGRKIKFRISQLIQFRLAI